MASKRRETLVMQNAHVRYLHRFLKQYGLDTFPKRSHCSSQSLAKPSQTKEHNKPFQPLPLSGPASPAGPGPAAAQRELEAPRRSPLPALPCQQPQIGSAKWKALQQHVGESWWVTQPVCSRAGSCRCRSQPGCSEKQQMVQILERVRYILMQNYSSCSIIKVTENYSLREQIKV